MNHGNQFHRRSPARCWSILLAAAAAVLLGRQFLVGPETAVAGAEMSTEKPSAAVGPEAGAQSVEKWVVMPVTTELQRVRAGRNARAYVLVDGEGFRHNRVTLDAQALNLDALRKRLQPYADPEKATVHFHIRCIRRTSHTAYEGGVFGEREGLPGEAEKPDYVSPVLRYALIGLGQGAGFRDASADIAFYHVGDGQSDGWETLLADLKKGLAEDAGREESGIGNERFTVYPVRTALSRFMYSDADCVLRVLGGGGIGPKEAAAVEQCVTKLKLKKKRKLCILCPFGPGGWYITKPTFYKERLGFERYTQSSRYNY